ncbi:MAG: tripartite tricarboxylate transporter substrate binding protein [Betaproteobacteria bacterium]|nr:tripartite tricarboxylate transporter substrate binding protein [Betaproteobacteria bacterium]MBI3054346.1 tripartite tricarboxylate transporter substrate binding protein [Betaproteobacteria bacterium]
MRSVIGIIGALTAGALAGGNGIAQTFPAKPIRLVVAFATGGVTDVFSRVMSVEMSKSLGQQVIVENRPGAGTILAAELVQKSAPDGHTLLFTDLATHAITPSLYAKLRYHPSRDFAAVAPVSSSPLIMVAHPSLGVKSAKELIALAKKHPGITCGNGGRGTVTHMASEKFRMRAGIDIVPVYFKGGTTSTISLLTGDIALIVTTIPSVLEYVRARRLVAIGLTADKRSSAMPDIPALGETVKGADAAVIAGVLAPAGTPRHIIDRLNAEFAKAVDHPKVREVFAANAAEAMKMSPDAMQQSLEQDINTWADVVKATGVQLQVLR